MRLTPLGGVRRDDGLRAAPGRRVRERVADLVQRKSRGDQLPGVELRHQGERTPERGAAAEGAAETDLPVVHVEEIEGQRAAFRVDADELQVAGRPREREG